MATFGLIHGAWHGAWCWEPLVKELEARDHVAVAMDLPSDQPSATFEDYADAAIAALPRDADLVLVGHSLGGMILPLVALQRPVRLMVFLCSLYPGAEGDLTLESPPTHLEGAFDGLFHHPDGSHSWPDVQAAQKILYQDCTAEQASFAFDRLRPQQTALWQCWRPLDRWPPIPVAAIHGREDRAINPEWSKWMASHRLGVESIELPGGHSPMLARPAALGESLSAIAANTGEISRVRTRWQS
ncbi:MAG: alpha/beta hydrolase [Candidatus Dormibacteraceae bacterium]